MTAPGMSNVGAIGCEGDDTVDRERMVLDFESNLFVEAGAGTGKTHQLVERVVELVATGALTDIRGLAAITFTEKAATELKERIRHRLESLAGSEDPGQPDAMPGPRSSSSGADVSARKARCRDALDLLDDAAIGTLHGFALRILADHPIEAGLPPSFEVRDPVAAAIDFDERWERFVDEMFDDVTVEPVLRRGFAAGLRVASLREVADELHQNWDRLVENPWPAPSASLDPIDPGPVIETIRAVVEAARTCNSSDRLVARLIDDLPPYLDRISRAARSGNELDLLSLLIDDVPPLRPAQLGGRDASIDNLRSLLTQALSAVETSAARLRNTVLMPLLHRLRTFTLEGARDRQRVGDLEYADLLVHATRLLERNAGVRERLGSRWPFLLIDEFQDTDPLQIRMATLLALTVPSSAPDRWEDSSCAGGRLFVVGDPKQSIYRFRRADIALYDRAKDLFADGLAHLTSNFRSVPGVIAWVNHIFAQLFGEGIPERQAEHRPLVATRPYIGTDGAYGTTSGTDGADGTTSGTDSATGGTGKTTSTSRAAAPVVVLGGPQGGASISEVRDLEAAHLAAYLTELILSAEPVSRSDGSIGPVRYDDVAILVPTRTPLPAVEQALDTAGVPYRIESRSLLFASDEVRELLAVLQAVDHPGNAVALVGALRAAAFGCSDRELAEYRWAGGQWSVRLPRPAGVDPQGPVASALAAIGRYHQMRHWLPTNELVELIIRERGLVELTLGRSRPRDRWRRFRLLLDEARAFVSSGGSSLGEFVSWVGRQAHEGATRVESIAPEPDDHAVRIMTVHAAKGLEFPVVVLAGLNGQGSPRPGRVLWPSARGASPEVRVGPKAAAFETAGYAQAAKEERLMDELERRRLLYVAATRARDKLVLSLYHKQRTPGTTTPPSLAELVWSAAVDAPVPAELRPSLEAVRLSGPSAEPVRIHRSGEVSDLVRAWNLQRAALLDVINRPRAVSPSSLAGSGEPRAGAYRGEAVTHQALLHPSGEGAGAAVGTAVHAVLARVDLSDPDGLGAQAQASAVSEGIPQLVSTVESLARAAMGSPSVRQAMAGGRFWRELYVASRPRSSAKLIEGYVDLLYETANGELVVVDYKTDRFGTEADLDAALEHHSPQGAAYALAVEGALGRPVSRCVFVFVGLAGAVERVVRDLDVAKAQVLDTLTG